MEQLFAMITTIVMTLAMVCFSYQAVYVLVGLFKKPKKFVAKKMHKYAVVISARNESAVIGNLIASVKTQTYDKDLVDVIVVADNCTDNTAQISRDAGAIVYERFNKQKVGKGYALQYLFQNVDKEFGISHYDGYFVIDADNILEEDYIENMNHVFDHGYNVVTSYRNSKNFGANWISFGYALWFLREAKFINNARMMLGVSCAVSGTGFLVSSKIIEKNKGWKHFLLTEDIEFSVDNILNGETIGYAGDAILYDEQPETMEASWHQRMRWSRGFYQVFYRYGKKLITRLVKERDFSCYDMLIMLIPGIGLTAIVAILGLLYFYFGMIGWKAAIINCVDSVGQYFISFYCTLLFLGAITLISEHKRIRCRAWKCALYLFTFPIFMLTYIPISVVALFHTPEWKPIIHSVSVTRKEIHETNY